MADTILPQIHINTNTNNWKMNYRVPRLRQILDELGLNNRGKRDVLVARLDQYLDENTLAKQQIDARQSEWLEADCIGLMDQEEARHMQFGQEGEQYEQQGELFHMRGVIDKLVEVVWSLNQRVEEISQSQCSESVAKPLNTSPMWSPNTPKTPNELDTPPGVPKQVNGAFTWLHKRRRQPIQFQTPHPPPQPRLPTASPLPASPAPCLPQTTPPCPRLPTPPCPPTPQPQVAQRPIPAPRPKPRPTPALPPPIPPVTPRETEVIQPTATETSIDGPSTEPVNSVPSIDEPFPKRTLVISDSTVRNIRTNDCQRRLNPSKEVIRVSKHPGATAEQVQSYCDWWYKNWAPNRLIAVAGANDMLYEQKESGEINNENELAERVINIGVEARGRGVTEICIMGLYSINHIYDTYTTRFNENLSKRCIELGFKFVPNSNIELCDLADGLHVDNRKGHNKLKHNILQCCESYKYRT